MRITSWTSAAALIALGASAALATTPAFEDNKLNIKGCDGSQVSVRWDGDNFVLSTGGKVTDKGTMSLKFVGWDGQCQSLSWNNNQAKFAIDRDGSVKSSALVSFMATDGSRWVGMREGDGFFVTRITKKHERPTAARIHEIAAWLERSGKPYAPGPKLGTKLKSEEID